MTHSTQPPDVTVRLAELADEAAIWPLAQALATSYVPERAAFARSFQRIHADPAGALLVADDSALGLVGYVHVLTHTAFHANGDIAWVEELIVDATQRHRGLGRTLMQAAERWAAETAQAAYLTLATRRAADFYRSAGYEESAIYFKRPLTTPQSR